VHTTRVTTFLLGAWLAVSLMLDMGSAVNLGAADELLRAPIPGAAEIVKSTGPDQTRLLLRHFAGEQNRHLTEVWEMLEIPLGLLLAAVLYSATDKRSLPLALCGIMLALVLAQYFVVSPELKYLGRNADFPHANAAEEAGVRGVPTADAVTPWVSAFVATEVVKIAVGGYLAGFLFYYQARRRKRNREEEAEEIARQATLRSAASQQPQS